MTQKILKLGKIVEVVPITNSDGDTVDWGYWVEDPLNKEKMFVMECDIQPVE
jgi:hypothetical protein